MAHQMETKNVNFKVQLHHLSQRPNKTSSTKSQSFQLKNSAQIQRSED